MAKHGEIWRSKCGLMELRLGRWQDVLTDIKSCDAVIMDPPYSERTHKGHGRGTAELNAHGKYKRKDIFYNAIDKKEAFHVCEYWCSVCSGWLCVFTDHVLYDAFRKGAEDNGFYSFCPLPVVRIGGRFRMLGDGPSSWTVWLSVNRPKNKKYASWGTLPGAYIFKGAIAGSFIAGAKSIDESRAVVSDYSKQGDLIVDPYAGSGTTLLAAAMEGRRCIGAEMDPNTFELAVKRLEKGYTPKLPGM
jgi:site-specific DNA-methyltransferase (adenine-specific)